jgi:hypothetical protein
MLSSPVKKSGYHAFLIYSGFKLLLLLTFCAMFDHYLIQNINSNIQNCKLYFNFL